MIAIALGPHSLSRDVSHVCEAQRGDEQEGDTMGFWKSAFALISDFLPSSVKRGEEVNTYTAGLFGLTIILLLAGLAIVLVTPLARPSVATGVSTGVVALLSALMCFAAGSVLGLLFGIPRYTKPDGPGGSIAPNNNLEQISDWLTKMIVGITLVQFGPIVQKTKVVALQITNAIYPCAGRCPDNTCAAGCQENYAIGLAIIVFFSSAGFLMMYLWSRIYLLLDVARVDQKMNRDAMELKKLRDEGRVQETTPRPERLAEQLKEQVGHLQTLAPSAGEIKRGAVPGDPWKGVFSGFSKHSERARELKASITPMKGSDYCKVKLTVRSTDAAKPLLGDVTFFLHDTFPNPIQMVAVRDGVASLEVAAWGAFTVGALADKGSTRLELDLSEDPTAPENWRTR